MHTIIVAYRVDATEAYVKRYLIKVKGISHECPEGEYMYSSTLSLTLALDGCGWSKTRHGRFVPGNDPITIVHSCQQKSIALKFSKSQTESDVRYSCHHISSRFTFPIFAHSCRFSVLHSLQSITPRIY